MKKILFSLIAVLGLFSACSNDDIEVQSTNLTTIKVNTQEVFDQFRITESVKKNYLAKNYSLGVYTFIYDNNGKLVASDSVYTKTFTPVNHEIRLPYGTYTAISLQMLVNEENQKLADEWIIVGKGDMNTLEVQRKKGYNILYYEALGSSSTSITISENNSSPELTNKAIGTMLQLAVLNLDKSGTEYNAFIFATKERAQGRFLSPKKSGAERYNLENYNEANYWYPRALYYQMPSLPEEAYASIYLLEEGDFTFSFAPRTATEENGYISYSTWTTYNGSNDKFSSIDGQVLYPGCYYLGKKDPRYTSDVFTTKEARQTWINEVEKKYQGTPDTPESSASAVPYIKWGANASSIKTHLESNGYTYTNGVITDDNKNWLDTYTNAQKDNVYGYYFETDKTNLKQIGVIYENLSSETILSALESAGFTNLGYDEDLGGYLGYSNDSMYLLTEVSGNRFILLLPYSSNAMHRSPAKWLLPNAQQRLEMFNSLKK